MLRSCSLCGRRKRKKTLCVETKKRICLKCCETYNEGCEYHFFCWCKIH